VLAAAGVGIFAWQAGNDSGEDRAAELAAADEGDGSEDNGSGDNAENARATSAPGVGLSAFEGRCMVIGESDAWFHTVYLYPEVGELLLYGDDRLLWSALEVTHHAGRSLEVSYDAPDDAPDGQVDHQPDASDSQADDQPVDKKTKFITVRSSSDKLIFGLEGDTPAAKKSKFVCRKHDVQKYYDTLGISGTFGHRDDDSREAVIPSSGQRITLDGEDYVYRILGGATLSKGYELALRRAEDTAAAWKIASMIFERDSGLLTLFFDGRKDLYRSKRAAREEAEQAADQAAREAAERREAARRKAAAKRKKAARAKAGQETDEQPAKAQAAPTTQSDDTDWDDPSNLPPHMRPAPERVYQKYAKKVRASVDRYCAVMDERSDQVAHHQKLVDEKRYDEAKTYRDEVLNDTAGYSQKIQAASYGYSNAVQRASQSGLNGVQIQKLTRMWQDGCE
jgi:hypothetical protein